MKIVYVTGCCGFIGSYVTRACLEKGWYVRGIDKFTYAANPSLLEEFNKYPNFTFEKIDINDIPFLYDCQYIINTAGETHVGNSIINSNDFISSNVCGVHHILELIRNYRTETNIKPILIQYSTDECYGDIVDGEHNETDILKPSSPYSASKSAADMLVLGYARTYNIPYIIIRLTNNFGKYQYIEKLIPKTCKYLMLGQKIPLHNQGKPTRNWLYVEDSVDALFTIINSGRTNEIFNIAGHFEQSNLITVEKIVKIWHGKDVDINRYVDLSLDRKGQDVRYALNDDKLQSLGWYPKRKFDEELPKIVEFYKNYGFIW